MTKPGAWWDPWTVAVTAAVVVVALVLHQRYAGATNRAVSHGE